MVAPKSMDIPVLLRIFKDFLNYSCHAYLASPWTDTTSLVQGQKVPHKSMNIPVLLRIFEEFLNHSCQAYLLNLWTDMTS